MFKTVVLGLSSYVLLSYFVWKEIRDDYLSRQIFGSSFIIVTSAIIFSYLFLFFANPYWFWGAFVGIVTGFFYSSRKYGLKKIEVLDGFVHGSMYAMFVGFLIFFAFSKGRYDFLYLAAVVFIINLFYKYFKVNYKKFVWYKSGRVGIAGFLSLAIFFAIRLLIAAFLPNMVTFVGRTDLILSGIGFAVLIYFIYRLSKI